MTGADGWQETKKKTSIKTKTLHPTFNELFEYKGLSKQDLLAKTLQVTVHADRLTDKNAHLGGMQLTFTDELLRNTEPTWYRLTRTPAPGHDA